MTTRQHHSVTTTFFQPEKKIQDAFISLFENSYNPTTLLEKKIHTFYGLLLMINGIRLLWQNRDQTLRPVSSPQFSSQSNPAFPILKQF